MMDHWIEELEEPERLILSWRAPENIEDRRRWAVGEVKRAPQGAVFRYFSGSEFATLNGGRTTEDLTHQGYAGYPAFDKQAKPGDVYDKDVLEAFLRRLPPSSRADFPRYLEHYRLRPKAAVGPMSLLAATEARLPSDGFSLIDPLNPDARARDLVFEVAGHRHHAQHRDVLRVGQALDVVAEPGNPYDTNAVRIEANGSLLGYVNRLQAQAIGRWLVSRSVTAWLLRLNGTPASPRAFAFLRMRPLEEKRAA